MKDIINSFKAHMYERTSSPLLGAFIFYWLLFNYKLIMVIIDGDMKLNEKFNLIKTLYPQEKITFWDGFDIYYLAFLGNGLLIPLLFTLIYILILPFASNFIFRLWITHQNNLKEISNGKVLTKKEFGELQRRFTELELSFDETFSKKDSEILKLKELISSKDSSIQKYQNENKIFLQKEEELLKQIKSLQENKNSIEGLEKKLENKDKIVESLKSKNNELNNKLSIQAKNLIEVEDLKKELTNSEEKIKLLKEEVEISEKLKQIKLNQEEEIIIDILLFLANHNNVTFSQIKNHLNIDNAKLKYFINTLKEKHLINYSHVQDCYNITSKGTIYLYEKNAL